MPIPVSLAAALLLACASQLPAAAGDVSALRPQSFDFDDLKMPEEASAHDRLDLPRFRGALARQGIVTVKMPDGFADLRQEVLTAAALCMGSSHADVATISLPDGTTRRTIAGESNTRGDGRLGAMLGAHALEECLRFERDSDRMRQAAAAVASTFGVRLAQAIESSVDGPSFTRLPEYRDARNSSSFAELALRGPRLEHFHAYERRRDFAETARPLQEQTLDFHADQGLFVVFIPGMMVEGGRPSGRGAGQFQVRSADEKGNFVARDLELEQDEEGSLVVLLGDALRQLGLPRAHELFHVPSHAFRMPGGSGENQRLWYGLMQLPPNDLVAQNVVDASTSTKLTFGEIREQVAAGAGHEGGSGIGCSPLAQWSEAAGTPRRLFSQTAEDKVTCAEGSVLCWMRCMEFPVGVSDAECAEMGENYSVKCVSQFDQVYVTGHGDFTPACSASTETVTPRPLVVQPEASGEDVSDSDWTTFTDSGSFAHKIVLDEGVGNTVLRWNAADGGSFHAKMIHRGYVGWMGWGLAHPGGHHNGMNGGQIVMGMSWDDGTLSVDEYRISEDSSAFRNWKTPLSESEPESVSLENASITIENGVSILEFSVQSSIYKRTLNLTSSNMRNAFIWGLTNRDYCTYDYGGYCGIHSTSDRDRRRGPEVHGVFWLDLASGSRSAYNVEKKEDVGDPGEQDATSDGSPQGPMLVWTAAIVALSLSAS